jgi:hypothetical protein
MTTKSSKDSTHVDHKDWGEGRSVTAKPGSGGSRRDFLESTSLAAASALLAPRGLFAADDGVAKTARTPGETTEATFNALHCRHLRMKRLFRRCDWQKMPGTLALLKGSAGLYN